MKLQVGVKAVIQDSKGAILLLKRSGYENLNDTWDIPGGRTDPSEPLLDALRREIHEEIGADLSATPVLIAAQDIFVPSKDLHVVRLTYRLREDVEVGKLSSEHSEARYVQLKELASMDVDPYLLELMKEELT